jgi:hypothetical protein
VKTDKIIKFGTPVASIRQVSKTECGYTGAGANNWRSCSACRAFSAPDGSCVKVAGAVKPGDTCNLFEPAGPAVQKRAAGSHSAVMARFSAEGMSDKAVKEGSYYIRTGKYFECDRPFTDMNGKTFSISKEKAAEMLPQFKPSPVRIEHTATIFDSELFEEKPQIRRLWLDGKDIMAEYAIPEWLQLGSKGKPIPVSSEWDMTTSDPIGVAFVLEPAVQDAAMMAAFSLYKARVITVPAAKTKTGDAKEASVGKGTLHMSAKAIKTKALFRKIAELTEEIQVLQLAAVTPLKGEFVGASLKTADFSTSPEFVAMTNLLATQNTAIQTMNANFAAIQGEKFVSEAGSQIDSLVRQMKMTPAEAETWRNLAKASPEAFTAAFATQKTRPVIAQFNRETIHAVNPATAQGGGTAAERLVAMSRERATAKKISIIAASTEILSENPDLARERQTEIPTMGGGGN